MTVVKIEIDVSTGKLLVEAPEGSFGAVLERLEGFLPKLSDAHANRAEPPPQQTAGNQVDGNQNRRKSKARRLKESNSEGGTGRYKDFTGYKLPLDDQQERDLRAYYEEKKPKSGKEKVAVILHRLPHLLGKDKVTYNEIYAALKIAGEKTLPKDLTAEYSRLAEENWADKDSDGLRLKAFGQDFVEQTLPRTE